MVTLGNLSFRKRKGDKKRKASAQKNTDTDVDIRIAIAPLQSSHAKHYLAKKVSPLKRLFGHDDIHRTNEDCRNGQHPHHHTKDSPTI